MSSQGWVKRQQGCKTPTNFKRGWCRVAALLAQFPLDKRTPHEFPEQPQYLSCINLQQNYIEEPRERRFKTLLLLILTGLVVIRAGTGLHAVLRSPKYSAIAGVGV
jgi:hypothetical protein